MEGWLWIIGYYLVEVEDFLSRLVKRLRLAIYWHRIKKDEENPVTAVVHILDRTTRK
jgi:hypothetical protein